MKNKTRKIKNIPQILTYIFFAYWLKPFLGLKIEGKEHIFSDRPILIISNHCSKLDPFVIISAMGWKNFLRFNPWRFPLGKYFADKWWIGKPALLLGCYGISGKGELAESLKDTFRYLDQSYSLIYFPEGRMVLKGLKREVKRGIGYVCAKKNVEIMPVRIKHMGFDKNGRGKLKGAHIIFGKPFVSRELREESDAEDLHLAVMDKVYELQ